MKTKKMLFKAAVCLMAVVIMMFSTVSALAAVDYVTTTTYDLGTDTVTVKTTVTGVTSGEVAYLVHTDSAPTDETIIYIDQVGHGTTDSFEFTTTKEKLGSVHSILVGTQEEAGAATSTLAGGSAVTYTLTVNVTNGSVALSDRVNTNDIVNVDGTANVLVGTGNDIDIATTAGVGFENGTVTKTLAIGNAEAVVIEGTELPEITADAVLTVEFAAAVNEPGIVEDPDNTVNSTKTTETVSTANGDIEKVSYTKYAKIENSAELTKYGVVVLHNVDNAVAEADLNETLKVNNQAVTTLEGALPEVVAEYGLFAFVIEGLSTEFAADLYVRTYAIFGEGTEPVYGEIQKYPAPTVE